MESRYYTHKTVKKRIDKHLKKIASINATLGIDSTNSEQRQAQKDIRDEERKIKAIDVVFYKAVFEFI